MSWEKSHYDYYYYYYSLVMEQKVEFQLLHDEAEYPTRQTNGSVGYDLTSVEDLQIPPQTMKQVNTGVAIKTITPGFYPQLFSRSGLAVKNSCVSCCGTIDSDFIGHGIKVLLYNTSTEEPVKIEKKDRIAQMVFLCTTHPTSETLRYKQRLRQGGLGSTGRR